MLHECWARYNRTLLESPSGLLWLNEALFMCDVEVTSDVCVCKGGKVVEELRCAIEFERDVST